MQGPYSGRRTAADGVLYPRYEHVQDLLDGKLASPGGSSKPSKPMPAKAQAAAANGVHAQPAAAAATDPLELPLEERRRIKREKRALRRVKPDGTSQEAAPQGQAAALPAEADAGSKAGKKADKKRKRAEQPQGSGVAEQASTGAEAQQPQATAKGNAEEARRMREALGYVPPSSQPPAAAAPVAPEAPFKPGAPPAKRFAFGFKVQQQVEAETDSKIARLMALDATKDGFVARRVWLCGMPHEYSEEDVRAYWEYCGPIESMDLLKFKDSGRFNGAAFVTFATEEGYAAALACNGEVLEGRTLKVDKCKTIVPRAQQQGMNTEQAQHLAMHNGSLSQPLPPRPLPPPPAPQAGAGAGAGSSVAQPEEYNVAYVGNIAFETTQEELLQLFEPHGATQVRLHTDKRTGRPKGFAHVHFGDKESLDSAMAVNGESLHGRALKVQAAQPAGVHSNAAAPAQPSPAPASATPPPSKAPAPPALTLQPPPQPSQPAGPASNGDAAQPDEHMVYVGNIAFETTQEELLQLFEPHGATQVRLHMDKRTGRPKGFAHVHFRDKRGMERAVAVGGTSLHGRDLKVQVAAARKGAGS